MFVAQFLQPRAYEIPVTKAGFAKTVQTGLMVQVGQSRTPRSWTRRRPRYLRWSRGRKRKSCRTGGAGNDSGTAPEGARLGCRAIWIPVLEWARWICG